MKCKSGLWVRLRFMGICFSIEEEEQLQQQQPQQQQQQQQFIKRSQGISFF